MSKRIRLGWPRFYRNALSPNMYAKSEHAVFSPFEPRLFWGSLFFAPLPDFGLTIPSMNVMFVLRYLSRSKSIRSPVFVARKMIHSSRRHER